MAKKTPQSYHELEFSQDDEFLDEDPVNSIMVNMIDTCNRQQVIALELTRLVAQKSPEPMNEEQIFSIFQRATKVTVDHFPLDALMGKLE